VHTQKSLSVPRQTGNHPLREALSLLRSIEDIFGLDHLGYAGQAGLKPFGADVFNISK
jgi:hypothetical protein